MSIEKYFTKLPKDPPLPISSKPRTQPPPKRIKRGPGRLREIHEPQPVVIVDSDSEKESKPDSSKTYDTSVESSETAETAEIELEKGKRLYGIKQKEMVVAYTKLHSVTAAGGWWTDTSRGR